MTKQCPNCGAENRDAANFCSICRSSMPAAIPVQPSFSSPLTPGATAIQKSSAISSPNFQNQTIPGTPISVNVSNPASPIVSQSSGKSTFIAKRLAQHELANGRITIIDPPRDAALPFDPSKTLVIFAVILLILGILIVTAVFSIMLFVVLAVLGLGSLCLMPVIIPILSGLIPSLIYIIRGKRTYSFVNFQVVDNGKPINSVIYLKEGAGNFHLGDCVRVYGRYQRNTNIVRAYKVEVYESNGKLTAYVVRGVRPWSLWLGIFIFVSVILLYGLIIFSGYLPQLFK